MPIFTAEKGKINYTGNKQYSEIYDITSKSFDLLSSKELLQSLQNSEHFSNLHKIDNGIFFASVEYFKSIGAEWCNLPLTTKMISSPGEIYAGKKLDYTTDALPVSLKWFDKGEIFLAESSQFYLELRLLIDSVQRVFSIYNSFRKEPADFSHLSEFQHIEFEGLVTFEKNINIYLGLIRHITSYLLQHNKKELSFYLTDEEMEELSVSFDNENIETLSFCDAMDVLKNATNDEKYKTVSLKNFGSYEEILLTNVLGKHCNVIEFPLEEIPFYHDSSFTDKDGTKFAKNADFILKGYREVVGSGQRITDIDVIREKAKFFNLPADDYEPYIELRAQTAYQVSCGFGLGWQRYTQWLLKLPYIWNASHIPRGQHLPKP